MASGTTTQIRERLRRGEGEARELGENVADIAQELRELAAQEVQLGVAEYKQQINHAIRAAIMGAVAFMVAELVLVFLGLAAMFALDTALQAWAAALITAGGFLLLSIILGVLAMTFFKKVTLRPTRMMESLKEDMTWAKSQIKSNGR